MSLKPGPELDARVAEAIGQSVCKCEWFGGIVCSTDGPDCCAACDLPLLPEYSTDANAALEAADTIVGYGSEFPANRITLEAGYDEKRDETGWCAELVYFEPGDDEVKREWALIEVGFGKTLPLAICAAILALKEKP